MTVEDKIQPYRDLRFLNNNTDKGLIFKKKKKKKIYIQSTVNIYSRNPPICVNPIQFKENFMSMLIGKIISRKLQNLFYSMFDPTQPIANFIYIYI